MGKEFKGADFFACRCATAPRMERINADPIICVMRWVARRCGRMHQGAMRLDTRRLATHPLDTDFTGERGYRENVKAVLSSPHSLVKRIVYWGSTTIRHHPRCHKAHSADVPAPHPIASEAKENPR